MAPSLLLHTSENGSFGEKPDHRPWYRKLFGTTFGTATVYLKKPVLPPISEYRNLLMRRNPLFPRRNGEEDGDRRGVEEYHPRTEYTESELTGSEVRLLRRVRIWEQGNLKPCPIDLGVGARLGMDPSIKLEPVARIRVADAVTVKLLPHRVIKLSKKLPFHFQGMQAHLRYEVPLADVRDSWCRPPARMLIRFEHGSNSGIHFYPGGLEFGDHTVPLGASNKAALRVAAGLNFPREYPARPENGFVWEVYRLGVKTVW